MDFLCDTVDLGYYFSVYQSHPFIEDLIPVPLYQLVYHDSVIGATTGGWIEDWPGELGSCCEPLHIPLYGLAPDDFSKRSLIMSKDMRETYYEEMTEHKFLTQDIQISSFSDGTKVIANFSNSPYLYEGTEVGPKGLLFIIKDKKIVLKKEEMASPVCPKPYFFKRYSEYLT